MAWVTISSIKRMDNVSATRGGVISITCPRGSYIYMCETYPNAEYSKYWRKTTTSGSTTSSSTTFNTRLDEDTSLTSSQAMKGFNVLASDTDLGVGPVAPGIQPNANDYVKTIEIPKWTCLIMPYGGVIPWEFNNYTRPNFYSELQEPGMTYLGLTTSTTSYSPSYTSKSWSSAMDGRNYYVVYQKGGGSSSKQVYYYRGTSSRGSTLATTWESKYLVNSSGKQRLEEEGYFGVESFITTCQANSDAVLQGWSTSSNSTNVQYTNYTDAYKAGYNTIYGVYQIPASQETETVYYYRGSNTRYDATKYTEITEKKYYGMGSTSGGQIGDTTYSSITTSCAVSGWNYLGFSSSPSVTSSYTSPQTLFNQGYTTIYGTYNQTQFMTYYPQNGSSTGQASVNNYRYGTGSTTNNRPSAPSLSYDNHTFQGWSKTSTGAVEDWNSLWDQGYRSVYAIWLEDYIYNVYYGRSNTWKKCKVYYGRNNNWEESQVYTGRNGSWQQ